MGMHRFPTEIYTQTKMAPYSHHWLYSLVHSWCCVVGGCICFGVVACAGAYETNIPRTSVCIHVIPCTENLKGKYARFMWNEYIECDTIITTWIHDADPYQMSTLMNVWYSIIFTKPVVTGTWYMKYWYGVFGIRLQRWSPGDVLPCIQRLHEPCLPYGTWTKFNIFEYLWLLTLTNIFQKAVHELTWVI